MNRVLDLYRLWQGAIDAGLDSFTVRRMLDRIERDKLLRAQATALQSLFSRLAERG